MVVYVRVVDDQSRDNQRVEAQKIGEKVAMIAGILGHHSSAPVIASLLRNDTQLREQEWKIVRDILESDKHSRYDLKHLSRLFEEKLKQQNRLQSEPELHDVREVERPAMQDAPLLPKAPQEASTHNDGKYFPPDTQPPGVKG